MIHKVIARIIRPAVLGDFCLGGSAEWTKMLDRLNGKIYLIMGNHDLKNIMFFC
ncbi:hypothetical protein M109_1793 [Bacteroides fragilis str. 3397 N2]|nr:hypothetical protein M109_1793 [Bacteroides fragilis str. 3397 N2]